MSANPLSRARLLAAVRYFATDFLTPDSEGRWGLPVTVHGSCPHDELDDNCPCVTKAENAMFEIERTLTAARAVPEGKQP